jgi:hypothetical protein
MAAVALWISVVGTTFAATAVAWRTRAIVALFAACLSLAADGGATTGWLREGQARGLALAFALISLAASGLGAALTRLLADEDGRR